MSPVVLTDYFSLVIVLVNHVQEVGWFIDDDYHPLMLRHCLSKAIIILLMDTFTIQNKYDECGIAFVNRDQLIKIRKQFRCDLDT